jgi:3-deoxy-D-manno-octulosonic acid (KDO) 8-phosphate synthase
LSGYWHYSKVVHDSNAIRIRRQEMSSIIVQDLETHEVLDSEALSEIHGGRSSSIYQIGSSLKPIAPSHLHFEVHPNGTAAERSPGDVTDIDNAGTLAFGDGSVGVK